MKIFDLDRAALFGERSSVEWRAAPGGQRAADGHARGGRPAEPRTEREVAAHDDGDIANAGASHRGFSERGVGRAARVDRRLTRLRRAHAHGRVARERDVADEPTLFVAVWRNIGPASAEVESSGCARE
jgi:hypothetical protein